MSFRLFVGNLPFDVLEEELAEHCEKRQIELSRVQIMRDAESGKARGFGFLEVERPAAKEAIRRLDGSQLQGRALQVDQANERPRRPKR